MMSYPKSCFVRGVGADVWAVLINQGVLGEQEVDLAVAVVMGILARHHGETIYNDPAAAVSPMLGQALLNPTEF